MRAHTPLHRLCSQAVSAPSKWRRSCHQHRSCSPQQESEVSQLFRRLAPPAQPSPGKHISFIGCQLWEYNQPLQTANSPPMLAPQSRVLLPVNCPRRLATRSSLGLEPSPEQSDKCRPRLVDLPYQCCCLGQHPSCNLPKSVLWCSVIKT